VKHIEAPAEKLVWTAGAGSRCENCGQSLVDHRDQRYCNEAPNASGKLDEAVLRGLINKVATTSNRICGDASEVREQRVKDAETAEEELIAYVRSIAASPTPA
jgi:hypothetical protein